MKHKYKTSERHIHTTLLSVASIILILTMIATLAHSAEVELQWNSVPEADGYNVYYGEASRTYQPPEKVVGQSQTTHTLTLDPGTYYFAVTAYNNYGESEYSEEIGPTTITASAPPTSTAGAPPTSVSLTPDLPSPQPEGTTVTFTAQATGGSGNYEYRFWIRNAVDGQWSIAQEYSSLANYYTWNATDTIDRIGVWARNEGSNVDDQAKKTIQFRTGTDDTPISVSLSSNLPSPQPEGTTLTFAAQATGGSGNYVYRFWIRNKVNKRWSIAQDYSSLTNYTWYATHKIDRIGVWARNVGSNRRYQAKDSIKFRTGTAPPTSVSLSSVLPSPQPEGTAMTFTAQAEGGSGTYEYRFRIRNAVNKRWSIAQDYSSLTNYTWYATHKIDRIGVWARNTGSKKRRHKVKDSIKFSTDMYPPTSVSLNSDLPSPQPEGTTITFTAQAIGGSGNYKYAFWQHSQDSGWTFIGDSSSSPTCTWTATGERNIIRVYAKNTESSGSSHVHESILFSSD
jgi:hypothetical protein